MDEQKLKEIFNKNKKTLMIICTEIEDNLNNIYFNQGKNNEDNNAMNKTQNINSSNKNSKFTKEQKEILKKINNYKIKIKIAQEELYTQLKLSKADELENTLKERKKYLENIKKENEVLKNIKNIQEKDEKEIKNIFNKKEELYSVNEKINKIKGEAKIKKDYKKKNIIIIGNIDKNEVSKLEGVLDITKNKDEYVVKISAEEYVSSIFKFISKYDNISKFCVSDASLEEIFVSIVGESYE